MHTLLCQIPILTTGKNFVTFLYGNFPLRVQVNAIEQVFAITTTGICHNSYSKYPLYCIYLHSQQEITVMSLGKNFSAIICYKHQQCKGNFLHSHQKGTKLSSYAYKQLEFGEEIKFEDIKQSIKAKAVPYKMLGDGQTS